MDVKYLLALLIIFRYLLVCWTVQYGAALCLFCRSRKKNLKTKNFSAGTV